MKNSYVLKSNWFSETFSASLHNRHGRHGPFRDDRTVYPKSNLHSIFVLFLSLLLSVLTFVGCSSNEPPKVWPSNGTVVKNIKWEIPFSDSLNVLSKERNLWILPLVQGSIFPRTTYTYYRKPKLQIYTKILGRVDQEIVHGTNTAIAEFYRFEKGSIYLIGYTSPDTIKPLTINIKKMTSEIFKKNSLLINKTKRIYGGELC